MSEGRPFHWEALHTEALGAGTVTVRIRPIDTLPFHCHLLWSLRSLRGLDLLGGYLVQGQTGVKCPLLGGNQDIFVPAEARNASLFLHFEPSSQRQGECFLRLEVLGAGSEPEPMEIEVCLEHAWRGVPDDLMESMETLRRLKDSGGTDEERRGYRSAAIRGLGSGSERRLTELNSRIAEPLALAGMPRDMQPMAFAEKVLALSEIAERGDVAGVRRHLEELPLAIQLNPDIRALADRARGLSGNPDRADEDRIGEVHRAMAQGKFEEAISLSLRVDPGRALFPAAQRARAEATIGLAWREVESEQYDAAKALASQPWVVTVLGEEHAGRKAVLTAATTSPLG